MLIKTLTTCPSSNFSSKIDSNKLQQIDSILLQQIAITRKNIQVAPSPWQLLNGQGAQRISRFKSECHGIRFGTLNVGSLCGRKTEVCEELRKRKVDVCCTQEVRWKGQGARFVGTLGRRYKLWWLGNDAGFGGVGILVKEEISGNVVEVRRKSEWQMCKNKESYR